MAATLIDLYAKARSPNLLRVAVVWQRAADETLPPRVRRLPNLEIIEVPYEQSLGCNWARTILQKMWQGEPYTLLLDSHHRFSRGWDQTTVDLHTRLLNRGIRRPLLTAYLPPYLPDAEPRGRKKSPYKIYPLEREQGLLVRLTGFPIPYWKRLTEPISADFVSLHFLFAQGRFNRDVPFDPAVYFHGDEVATSVRAYTGGYDLFHPHVVLGWHCYSRQTRVPHWDDHAGWRRQHIRSLGRLRMLFSGRLRGRFGAGKHRSVRRFEDELMIPLVEQPA